MDNGNILDSTLDSTLAPIRTSSVIGHNVLPQPSEQFVCTPYVQELTERALTYLEVGYPIHFAGPAGTGKSTLAFHVASKFGQPVSLVHGDDEFGSSDLVGRDSGYRKSRVVDNYIHSVVRTEENMNVNWVDNRLTTACRDGHTLIYDEFNRSRPEANNVLLSVLSERLLNLPKPGQAGQGYIQVHPSFRAIFTSNPEEYAGNHKTQDALMDRLITIELGHYDRESEVEITIARSGIDSRTAETIVDIVRGLRGVGVNNHRPTIRACIAIARVLAHREADDPLSSPFFVSVCQDVLGGNTTKISRDGESIMAEKIEEVVKGVRAKKGRAPRTRKTNSTREKE